jgi:hypothetical protein
MKFHAFQFILFTLGLLFLIGAVKYNRVKHKKLSILKPTLKALEPSSFLEPYLILPIQWLLSKMPWIIIRSAIILIGLALMFLSFFLKASLLNEGVISTLVQFGIAVAILVLVGTLINKVWK